MSYDVILVEKLPDEDWDAALERMEENASVDTPLSRGTRQRWRAAADRLLESNPEFELHDGPDSVEMIHDEFGMVVSMFELEAGLSVAYWHTGADSEHVMRTAGTVVDILKEASGWSAWDPQLGRELREGADLVADGAGMMSDVARRVPGMIAASSDKAQPAVPWWRFWAKRNR